MSEERTERRAVLNVPRSTLHGLLHLPEGVEVGRVFAGYDELRRDTILIGLHGEGLPTEPVAVNILAPEVVIQYEPTEHGPEFVRLVPAVGGEGPLPFASIPRAPDARGGNLEATFAGSGRADH